MATADVQPYIDALNIRLKRIERAKTIVVRSSEQARRGKRSARATSIALGILITLVGIVLAQLPDGETFWRKTLSWVSAFAGALVGIISERADPAKLREREVALGDLSSQLGALLEDARLALPDIQTQGADAAKVFLEQLRTKEDALLEKAEEFRAGVRRFVESDSAP